MITKLLQFASLAVLISSALSCSSDPPEHPNPPRPLLRSTVWVEANEKSEYTYNPDSTIHKITVSGGGVSIDTYFSYENGRLKDLKTGYSTTTFEYNPAGRISRTVKTSTIYTSKQIMEYTYAGNRLEKLEYFLENEAGKTLQWKNTYAYSSIGVLTEVLSENDGSAYLHIIESYSPEMDYQPWAFIDYFSLQAMYPIYSLPPMEMMPKGKLPTRIVRKFRPKGGEWELDAVTSTDFSIESKRITRTKSTSQLPRYPEGNSFSEVEFHY